MIDLKFRRHAATVCGSLMFIAAVPADARILSCLQLKQNCQTFVAKRLDALAHTNSEQAGHANRLSPAICEKTYVKALETGLWEGDGERPSLPCSK